MKLGMMVSALAVVVALGGAPAAAQTATGEGAVTVLNNMVRKGSGSVDSIYTELLKIVDVNRVTTRVLKERAAAFTPEQRQRFDVAFIRTLAVDLSQTVGQARGDIEMTITGAGRRLAGGEIAVPVMVRGQNVGLGDGQPGGLILAPDATGEYRLIDMEFENRSVVQGHADEMVEMWEAASGNPESVIAGLEESVAAVAVSGGPAVTAPANAPMPQPTAEDMVPLPEPGQPVQPGMMPPGAVQPGVAQPGMPVQPAAPVQPGAVAPMVQPGTLPSPPALDSPGTATAAPLTPLVPQGTMPSAPAGTVTQ